MILTSMMTVVPAPSGSMLTLSMNARISGIPLPRNGVGAGPGGSQRPLSVTVSRSVPAVTEARSRISPAGRSRWPPRRRPGPSLG